MRSLAVEFRNKKARPAQPPPARRRAIPSCAPGPPLSLDLCPQPAATPVSGTARAGVGSSTAAAHLPCAWCPELKAGKSQAEGQKIPSVEENNNGVSSNAYEQQRNANIELNKRRLAELNLTKTTNNVAQQGRPSKTAKKKHIRSTETPTLRPRTQRKKAQPFAEQVPTYLMPDGELLCNNEGNFLVSLGVKLEGGCHLHLWTGELVDDKKKYDLWTDIKGIYDIDDDAYNWFMRTAAKKWKEFKATIKEKYFKPSMTIEAVGESRDSRIPDPDWKFLFKYWISPEFQLRSEKAKANRKKLQLHHTSGSISYACSEYDLALELGRPPRRDENFVKTHTRKNGVSSKQAELIIKQLEDIIEVYPELKEQTIQEGDAFAVVCGLKEPKGYVRGLGLGPTPQDIGTPGLKCYAPTRLQMEILARKKAQSEKAALEQRIDDLQARIALIEQRGQQDRASEEPMSQHASTTLQQVQDLSKYKNKDAALHEDEDDYDSVEGSIEDDDEDDQMHSAAQSGLVKLKTTPMSNNAARSEQTALVGKDVILYAMLRSNQPVVKGTIMSTKPSTVLGGKALGREFCEVIVTCVLKRDAMLPRPYDHMDTLADAHMMAIAWPYKKLKITDKEATPRAGSGSIARS